MTEANQLLENAINKRLSGHGRDIWVFVVLGVVSTISGIALFGFLWLEFRTDETQLVSQLAGGATALVTAGIGGAFLEKVVSLRQEIRVGREWLLLYEAALGPPPDDLVPDIQSKILSWLEG